MRQLLRCLIDTDEGQDIVEYALLLAFIALVSVVVITSLGSAVSGAIGNADTQLRSDGGI